VVEGFQGVHGEPVDFHVVGKPGVVCMRTWGVSSFGFYMQ
jgi:hypothetical protein